MIKITITSGPYAGRSRTAEGATMEDQSLEAIFHSLVQEGWHWEIDYSQATPEEAFLWSRQDLGCRCVLALKEGRPVYFQGEVLTDFSNEGVGRLEDAIVNSGKNVTVDRDDEAGLWIGVRGWTQ
ncbi:MAG: hypothetical protein WCT37_03000 [Patescibacteria group bacterium]|jgi:hypothetical protein